MIDFIFSLQFIAGVGVGAAIVGLVEAFIEHCRQGDESS
jgi:hypothetical protein